ncbi:MAG: hypothetical protein HKM89_05635, partial [Gemmatimonadales bacterium]|nr:hypothetical protein [Gemmatimonadales bacterium]
MVKVIRVFVVMTLLLVFAAPASAKGPNHQVPIKGTVMGEHVRVMFDEACSPPPGAVWWSFSSDGEGQMSHLGRVEYSLTQCTSPSEDGTLFESVGTVTFTAANNDKLFIEHNMTSWWAPDPPPGFIMEGNWWAVGGTGRFATATGHGTLNGVGDI